MLHLHPLVEGKRLLFCDHHLVDIDAVDVVELPVYDLVHLTNVESRLASPWHIEYFPYLIKLVHGLFVLRVVSVQMLQDLEEILHLGSIQVPDELLLL